MKRELANSIAKVIYPFQKLVRADSERIPVLCYHRILPDYTDDKASIHAITPAQFESQLAFLAKHGFQSLSIEEFRGIMSGSQKAPSRAVLVTFDDGFADNYHVAWPLAMYYGMKINLFIVTSFVDGSEPIPVKNRACSIHKAKFPELWQPMTWEEIRDMKRLGVGVGLHGHRHRNLATIEYADVRSDLECAVKLFTEQVGGSPWAFALPYGSVGQYNRGVLKALENCGFEMIFSTISGRARPARGRRRSLLIPRITIHQDEDLGSFELKVFGARDWLESVQRFRQIAWECSIKARTLFKNC